MISVIVYASRARPDTYLYVPADRDLAEVPEPLLARLQPLRQALTLDLDEQTQLAQAQAKAVLAQLHTAGYYLQLPPQDTDSDRPA